MNAATGAVSKIETAAIETAELQAALLEESPAFAPLRGSERVTQFGPLTLKFSCERSDRLLDWRNPGRSEGHCRPRYAETGHPTEQRPAAVSVTRPGRGPGRRYRRPAGHQPRAGPAFRTTSPCGGPPGGRGRPSCTGRSRPGPTPATVGDNPPAGRVGPGTTNRVAGHTPPGRLIDRTGGLRDLLGALPPLARVAEIGSFQGVSTRCSPCWQPK